MSSPEVPVRIEPGQVRERPLAQAEMHAYLLAVQAGEYFRVAAEQRGVDLAMRLLSPSGDLIAEVDSPTGMRGAERVSEVASASGDYRIEVVGVEGTPPGTYEIRIEERGPATPVHRRRVEGERAFLAGEKLRREHKETDAIGRYEQALTLYQESGDLGGQAAGLYAMGRMRHQLDQWEAAAQLCARAAELYRQAGDPTGQAQALNRYGRLLGRLDRYQEARQPLEEAEGLFRATGDVEGEASALLNLGNVHNWGGRFEQAVDAYDRALEILRQIGNRREEALALESLGVLYLSHGKWSDARARFEETLRIADEIGARDVSAEALDSLGLVGYREGRLAESRERSERALALYRELGDRRGQAMVLNSLGTVLLKSGDREGARERYTEALTLFRAVGDPQGEAMAESHLGRVALAEGDARRALEIQHEALAGFERLGNQAGQSQAHYVMAQARLLDGDIEGARREVEASLKLAESRRAETPGLDLRASYFSTRQHYWELSIDVLLRLDRLHPDQGYAARALEADERRRARSLLDALSEAHAGLRQSVSPDLLREEADLERRLAGVQRPEERDDLLLRLDRVRTQMREANPRLARIEGPNTLSLAEIRELLLDVNTLLLVYSLGEERSVLWKVTRSTLAAVQLPGRERIEQAARLAYDVLSHRQRPGSVLRREAVEDLTALVLQPLASDLPKYRRLLIVGDGALQVVPFAALPDPGAEPVEGRQPLLVEGHTLVFLPSASVVASLRRERKSGPLGRQGPLVAVVADPVFDASDPRVQPGIAPQQPRKEAEGGHLARATGDLGLAELERLPFSRQEAEAIRSLWPQGDVETTFDFDARREILDNPRWRRAPILHFATHSLLDDRQPELSGLVFTLVNPDGTRRPNGFLRLHEIYGLELDADLVVLSACQTGIGKDVRGEGLLGIARGFMSVGVPQLVASLWKVEDRATSELMARFYRGLFNGEPPPEALALAQRSMLREDKWSDPALWAGFIFLGDFARIPDGGIELRDTGGADSARKADGAGLPPPKVRRPKPRPKPAEGGPTGATPPKSSAGDSSAGLAFACYAPSEIGGEAWHTLLAYCFREVAARAVSADAARRLAMEFERYEPVLASATHPIAAGSDVLIVPELEGCRFNPPQASLNWLEDWHCAEFRFQIRRDWPAPAPGRELSGRLSFFVGSVLIADVTFGVNLISSPRSEPDQIAFRRTDAQPYQSVFISYSHADALVVETLESVLLGSRF